MINKSQTLSNFLFIIILNKICYQNKPIIPLHRILFIISLNKHNISYEMQIYLFAKFLVDKLLHGFWSNRTNQG